MNKCNIKTNTLQCSETARQRITFGIEFSDVQTGDETSAIQAIVILDVCANHLPDAVDFRSHFKKSAQRFLCQLFKPFF